MNLNFIRNEEMRFKTRFSLKQNKRLKRWKGIL